MFYIVCRGESSPSTTISKIKKHPTISKNSASRYRSNSRNTQNLSPRPGPFQGLETSVSLNSLSESTKTNKLVLFYRLVPHIPTYFVWSFDNNFYQAAAKPLTLFLRHNAKDFVAKSLASTMIFSHRDFIFVRYSSCDWF